MNKKEEIREWVKYGKNDYDTAVFLQKMTPPPLEIICYHCQQAAEKYLKSFLVSENKPVELPARSISATVITGDKDYIKNRKTEDN